MNENQRGARYCVEGRLSVTVKAVFSDDGVHDLRTQAEEAIRAEALCDLPFALVDISAMKEQQAR
jgi:hypothetical protein